MRLRCFEAGLYPIRRKGTYQSLPHPHRGYLNPQQLTPEADNNLQRYQRLQQNFQYQQDGLSSLNFSICQRVKLTDNCFQISVDLGLPNP